MSEYISVRVQMDKAEQAELAALSAAHGLTLSDAVRRGTRSFLDTLTLAKQPGTPRGRPSHRKEKAAA